MIPGGFIGLIALVALYIFWKMNKKQEERRGRYIRNKNLLNKKEETEE